MEKKGQVKCLIVEKFNGIIENLNNKDLKKDEDYYIKISSSEFF